MPLVPAASRMRSNSFRGQCATPRGYVLRITNTRIVDVTIMTEHGNLDTWIHSRIHLIKMIHYLGGRVLRRVGRRGYAECFFFVALAAEFVYIKSNICICLIARSGLVRCSVYVWCMNMCFWKSTVDPQNQTRSVVAMYVNATTT